MAGLKRDDFAADCGSAATRFRCRFWIGSDTVFAADTEIGSDLVSAADTEIGSDPVSAADIEIDSDAVSAADSGSAAMQSLLPIQKSAATQVRCRFLDRQRCSFGCRF